MNKLIFLIICLCLIGCNIVDYEVEQMKQKINDDDCYEQCREPCLRFPDLMCVQICKGQKKLN